MAGHDESSDSESSSSSRSSSSTRRRHERRERKRREKEENERRRKDKHEKKKKKDKEKKRKKDKSDHERNIITGKRIRRSEGDRADADGEERRARVREALNGGDESLAKEPPPQRTEFEELQHRARFDPDLMRELMEKGHEAQRAKAAKRGKVPESAARRQYYADLLAEKRDDRSRLCREE